MPASPVPRANSDLVALTWLRSIPGIDAGMVATTLPSDVSKWATAGFIVASIPGGAPWAHIPVHRPVVSLDFWAANLAPSGDVTSKPPWGKAHSLAELVRAATYEDIGMGIVELPVSGLRARLLSVFPLTEPRRVSGDDARYAHYQFDALMHWADVH
jgi:hypothetical protein